MPKQSPGEGRMTLVFGCKADMAGILIIAHAPLATALRECVAHIYGGLPARIGGIDILPDCDPVKLFEHAQREVARLREDNGALVLTDMYGATPANIACRLSTLPDVRVLAGVNLPMLVRSVCYRALPLDQVVEKALAGAASGVQAIDPHMVPSVAATPSPCLPATATGCADSGTQATQSATRAAGTVHTGESSNRR
jgi:PTS system mannose-specific IIA component